jgi:hypothetical protein
VNRIAIRAIRLRSTPRAREPAVFHDQRVTRSKILASDTDTRKETPSDRERAASTGVYDLARGVGENAILNGCGVWTVEAQHGRPWVPIDGPVAGPG